MTGALLLAAVIWGSGTVFMQACIDGGIETGLQMFFRFWIGTLCLGRWFIKAPSNKPPPSFVRIALWNPVVFSLFSF